LRLRTGSNQGEDAAARMGVPVDTVREWEQGKRAPQGQAGALLRIIDRVPETVLQISRRMPRRTIRKRSAVEPSILA
jgi:DNA-binding transcriptional regulator YiaG